MVELRLLRSDSWTKTLLAAHASHPGAIAGGLHDVLITKADAT